MTDWTKDDDIALIEEYLGYETWTTPARKALYSIDGNAHDVPDMTARDCALTLDCLDSWLSVQPYRHVKLHQHSTTRRRFVWLFEPGREDVPVGEGRSLHEAVARALRAAVGQ